MKRNYTTFGKILRAVLTVASIMSFILLLGYTGSCELDIITVKQYTVRAIPCLLVFAGSLYLMHEVFDS